MATPRSALATTPRWVELGPPLLRTRPVLYDSQRNRALVLSDQTIWAVAGDQPPSWTPVWTGSYPLAGGSFVYDPARDRIWAFTLASSVFAGSPARIAYMDLSSTPLTWVEQSFTGSAPANSLFYAAALDPVRDQVIVFGGIPCAPCAVGNSISVLSLAGTPAWSTPSVAGTPPTARYSATAVYDPVRDRMLFFGGAVSGATATDELWALSLAGNMRWSFLTPSSAVAYARWGAIAVLDSVGQRMLVVGGHGPGAGPTPDPQQLYNDAWALDLSHATPADSARWQPLFADPRVRRPPTREAPVGWLDRAHQRVLRFGGTSPAGDARVGMWSLSLGTSPDWTAIVPDSLRMPARSGHIAIANRTQAEWDLALGSTDAVWSRRFNSDAPWHLKFSGGPGLRYGANAVHDDAGPRAIIFGGGTGDSPLAVGTEYADVWSFDDTGTSWKPLSTPLDLDVRADALTVLDKPRRRLIVHGGRYNGPGKVRPRTDTLLYWIETNQWVLLPAGGYGGRWGEAGIYDPVRNRVVAFGGVDTLSTYADVHVLPAAIGGTWSALATSGTPPPVTHPRSIRAAYDATLDRMFVLAADDTQLRLFALTLDANPTWSQVGVSGGSPFPRQDYATAFDATARSWLVAGGLGVSGAGNLLDDAWVLYLDPDASVNAALSATSVSNHVVAIEWQESGAPVESFTAYRRAPAGAWQAIATLIPDGAFRRLELTDTDIQPGERYDYRLGTRVGGTESFFGDVSVDVPSAVTTGTPPPFAARPNPVTGALDLGFTLAATAPARLELLDVTGRRILDRFVGVQAPGDHVFRVAQGGALHAGLYFARLTVGRERRVAKVVIAP